VQRSFDALGARELLDREQQRGRSLRPGGVRQLQRGGRPYLARDDPGVEHGAGEKSGDRLGFRAGKVEPSRPGGARRRADDPAVDAVRAAGRDDSGDLAGRGRGDRVGVDEEASKARDRAGDLERRVRRADGEDHLAPLSYLVQGAGVLETRLLRALASLLAAPSGRPQDAISAASQRSTDRSSHLAGMEQTDRRCSHYTGTLTIVWLGGRR
jgi:hypothetical protein